MMIIIISTHKTIYSLPQINKNNNIFNSNYKNHIIHGLTAGIIGPEIKYVWDKIPTRQIIRVIYISECYYDIVDWERDVTFPSQMWQISNINGIII